MSSNLTVAALRDMGCVRTNNEDNFAYDPVHDLYVVCDGMGGMAAGEVASSIACSTLIESYTSHPADTPALTRLAVAIRAANDAVRASSAENAEQHGMGTTLVAAVVEGNKVYVGNVGDSRAYLLQNSVCVQLTVDHSYINELVRNGTVKVEDIHSVNLRGLESVITRAIGAAPEVDPDFFAVDLRENDTLLLASDGLTRYVNSADINSMIDINELDQSCHRLIEAAKSAGGADNITCLLLRYNAPAANQLESTDQAIQTSVETPTPSHHIPEPLAAEPASEYVLPSIEEAPIHAEPVAAEPIPEEPAYEEPTQEEPVQQKPVQQDPVEEDPIQEDPIQEEPAFELPYPAAPEDHILMAEGLPEPTQPAEPAIVEPAAFEPTQPSLADEPPPVPEPADAPAHPLAPPVEVHSSAWDLSATGAFEARSEAKPAIPPPTDRQNEP